MNLDAYHAALAALAIAEERLRTIRRLIAGAARYDDPELDGIAARALIELIQEEAGDGIDAAVP